MLCMLFFFLFPEAFTFLCNTDEQHMKNGNHEVFKSFSKVLLLGNFGFSLRSELVKKTDTISL